MPVETTRTWYAADPEKDTAQFPALSQGSATIKKKRYIAAQRFRQGRQFRECHSPSRPGRVELADWQRHCWNHRPSPRPSVFASSAQSARGLRFICSEHQPAPRGRRDCRQYQPSYPIQSAFVSPIRNRCGANLSDGWFERSCANRDSRRCVCQTLEDRD